MLFALGLGKSVVAVTHECDFPAEARSLPQLTRSEIPEGLPPGQVDSAVREVTDAGRSLYVLDEELLADLEVNLIVTQALCAVCAVSYDDVRAVAERLPTGPAVISLDPTTIGEVLEDVTRLGEAAGDPGRAGKLKADLKARLNAVTEAVARAPRPRVAALEWLDPPYVGGHWIPEMIEAAGGTDPLGARGQKSRTAGWEEVRASRPDVVVAMQCGYDLDESRAEAEEYWDRISTLGAGAAYAVDAAASFSRPGPRLVDGTELLGHLLHPDLVAAPDGIGWAPIEGPDRAAI
jgi:iron complex transport system substrate-binding protein